MHSTLARISARTAIALSLAAALEAAAGAGPTQHRDAASQVTGSENSTGFFTSNTANAALQGQVGGSAIYAGLPYPFGLFGFFNGGSTFGIGALGISSSGYGVAGESMGSNPSVLAYGSGTGVGLESVTLADNSSAAIYGEAKGAGDGADIYADSSGAGIYAYSTGADGLDAESGTSQAPANFAVNAYGYNYDSVYADNYLANDPVYLSDSLGGALYAYGNSGSKSYPVANFIDERGGTDLLGAFGYGNGNGRQENFIVQAGTLNESGEALSGGSDVQVSGDLYVFGKVFQDCNHFPAASGDVCYLTENGTQTTLADTTRTSGGAHVETYSGHQSLPTVEDFGTAQVVNGRAYVRLDPTYAKTIATQSPYMVFVTPEGDNRGVFTTNKTPNGFEVRESNGGHSTFAFDYRIVARPFGDTSQRFPALQPKPAHIPTAADKAERALETRFANQRRLVIARTAAHHKPPAIRGMLDPTTLHN